eukprot:1519619-Amphidinium_carterae.1
MTREAMPGVTRKRTPLDHLAVLSVVVRVQELGKLLTHSSALGGARIWSTSCELQGALEACHACEFVDSGRSEH